MKIEIKPFVRSASNIDIDISVHDDSAMANCTLTYDNSRIVEIINVKIEGEEYAAWGSDDSYIYNLILSKIGAERK